MTEDNYYLGDDGVPTIVRLDKPRVKGQYKFTVYQLGDAWGISKIPKGWKIISRKRYEKECQNYESIDPRDLSPEQQEMVGYL